jgi:hypothetical protein
VLLVTPCCCSVGLVGHTYILKLKLQVQFKFRFCTIENLHHYYAVFCSVLHIHNFCGCMELLC